MAISIVIATLEECSDVVEPEKLPCHVSSTWEYPNSCNTYLVKVYNLSGGLLDVRSMGDLGIYCNFTMNYTESVYYNITSGDTGLIIVREDNMMLAMIIGASLLMIILLYFAFQLDENHFLLKLLLIFFSLMTAMIIPATIVNGVRLTQDNFLNITIWLFRIFVIYFSVYLFWHWIQRSEKMMAIFDNLKSGFRRR